MAETTVTYEKGKLYHLDLTQLQTDPGQPRKYIDPQALDELAASIASSTPALKTSPSSISPRWWPSIRMPQSPLNPPMIHALIA